MRRERAKRRPPAAPFSLAACAPLAILPSLNRALPAASQQQRPRPQDRAQPEPCSPAPPPPGPSATPRRTRRGTPCALAGAWGRGLALGAAARRSRRRRSGFRPPAPRLKALSFPCPLPPSAGPTTTAPAMARDETEWSSVQLTLLQPSQVRVCAEQKTSGAVAPSVRVSLPSIFDWDNADPAAASREVINEAASYHSQQTCLKLRLREQQAQAAREKTAAAGRPALEQPDSDAVFKRKWRPLRDQRPWPSCTAACRPYCGWRRASAGRSRLALVRPAPERARDERLMGSATGPPWPVLKCLPPERSLASLPACSFTPFHPLHLLSSRSPPLHSPSLPALPHAMCLLVSLDFTQGRLTPGRQRKCGAAPRGAARGIEGRCPGGAAGNVCVCVCV